MTTRASAIRAVALAAVLVLGLTACGGTDDADTAGLPTAEDLGAGDGAADGDGGPVSSAMCIEEEPDCEDMIVVGEDDEAAGGAAGSCLVGDEDCTDESYGGQDLARLVPLSSEPSGADPAEFGATSGATGHRIEHAHLIDDTTIEITVGDNPCMLVEDVLVEESPEEVRIMVLAGQDATADACIESYVQFALEVELDAPLGDRALVDLAG